MHVGKSTKKQGIGKENCLKIWSEQKNVYICNVKLKFDYPGEFPERASRKRHYPFKTKPYH